MKVLVTKLGHGKLVKLDSKENRKGLFLFKKEPLSYISKGETGNFSSAAVDQQAPQSKLKHLITNFYLY